MTNRPFPPSARSLVARRPRGALALLALFALLLAAPGAHAQEGRRAPVRLVVLPFDTRDADPAWEFGLATLVQRSLNAFDRIYVPPVGDAALFSLRAGAAGDPAALERAFGADAVIAGYLEVAEGGGFEVTAIATRDGVEPIGVRASAATPEALAAAVVQSALQAAVAVTEGAATDAAGGLEPAAAEVQEALRVAGEIPPPQHLAAVANASSRIGAPDLPALEAAVAAAGGSSWARAEYARALALAGRLDEALAEAARAQEAQPVDVEAIAARGVIELAAGRRDAARASFDRALALAPSHAPSLTGRARLEPDEERARELLRRAVAASPRYVDARIALADLAGSPASALQSLRRAADELPESIALHREIVERALTAGDPAGALAYLRDAAERPLAASPALYALARLAAEARPEAALELVREGRERYPDDAALARLEIGLLNDLGRSEEAAAAFEEAAELVVPPGETVGIRLEGEAATAFEEGVERLEAGDASAAADAFARAREAGDEPLVAFYHGVALQRSGRERDAVAAYEAALEGMPGDGRVLANLGFAWLQLGRFDRALPTLREAVDADASNARAHLNLGLAYYGLGRWGDALAAWEEATRLEPGLAASIEGPRERAARLAAE